MKRKYLIEGTLFLTYVSFALSWVCATVSIHNIMDQMGIHTLTLASTLSSAVTIAKIVGTAIAALIVSRLGLRHAISVATLLICCGILTPLAPSFPVLLISRFLVGLGGALLLVYFNPIAVEWFTAAEMPFVNGLNNTAFNIGATLALFFMPWASSVLGGWRTVLLAVSALSIVLTLVWLIFGKTRLEKGETVVRAQGERYRLRDGLRDAVTWNITLTYAGLLSFYIVLFTFYPSAGIQQTETVLLSGIAGGICGMVAAGRVKSRRLLLLRVFGVIQLVAAFALSFAAPSAFALGSAIVLGFSLTFPVATLLTLGQDQPGMTTARVSVRFSIFWSTGYLVATIWATVFAKIVDLNHGNYHTALLFNCLIEGSFLIGALLLKDRRSFDSTGEALVGDAPGTQPG
ncbi:MFS transporter [Burkholderia sp. A9]|uniref:MFS transporter n=1 Tax=Burkholderia sp. A9 TaxID=1365108 RepID=UPI000694BD92|nr:MFS transporter [Burkholderia sp. A9]